MTATALKEKRSITELERILALPSREPVDCERDHKNKRWSVEGQALIEVVTSQYALPERRTCACRERRVLARGGGRIVVYGAPAPGEPPPLPEEMTTDEFRREAVNQPDAARLVSDLRPNQEIRLEGISQAPCIIEFNPFQAWALWELPRARGLFGMGSVGVGKTVFFIMAPLTMPSLKTWVMLAKPDQRLHYMRHYLRLREHFRVPTLVFNRIASESFIVPGAPVLHFVPYSVLSKTSSTTLFEELRPEAVLADEAHCCANTRSSRGGRFSRTMIERNGCVFAGATATPIDKSIKSFAPLLMHALGTGSPMPLRQAGIDAWGGVFDPVRVPDTDSKEAREIYDSFGDGAVDKELLEAGLADTSVIRTGLRKRLVETFGLVSSKTAPVSVDLIFHERKIKMAESLREPLRGARLGTRPDGEELEDDDKIASNVRAVSAGYHYYWAYPRALPEHRIRGGLIDQWFEARKAFNKELRVKQARNEPFLDSRKLCENAAIRAYLKPRYTGDLPVWEAATWPAWAEIKDQVYYEQRTRWLDDYLARDAAEWAKEHVGIVWSRSRAFGQRVAELAGITYCGGGPNAEALITAQDGSKSIVASLRSHGESRDGLQYKFSKQLFAENIPSGKGMQQLLGRLIRPGQAAEEIHTWVYRHTVEYREDFDRAEYYAEFLQTTTPEKQLILSASKDF